MLKHLSRTSAVALCLLLAPTTQAGVVSDFLGNRLLCEIAELDLADMQVQPLYSVDNGQCVAAIPSDDNTAWFNDSQCTIPVTFSETRMQDYCSAAVNDEELGNGLGIRNNVWTITPGNQLNLGARSLYNVTLPYMQRLIYREVQTERGRCDLEMRIYKSHPAATGQRSMLALHGGSWTSRTFGYLGLELTVPHYVDQGFVVYAPFYRLLDDTDSSTECNQADLTDIVEDGSAALDWVLSNASTYGSGGEPIVFGQSAGAHLALSLSVNRPNDVSGSVLLYPPTDFTDFLLRVQSGAYTDAQGLDVLGRVVDSSPQDTPITLPLIVDNSFPQRIATEGGDWPPMFIMAGSNDDLVEARQSVRLCDALAGRELPGTDQEVGNATELREVVSCGGNNPRSQLHLIRNGGHALDVCINPNFADLCPSGGSASSALVSQSVSEALSFSVDAHQASVDAANAAAQEAAMQEAAAMQQASMQEESTAGEVDVVTETTDSNATVSTGGGGGAALGLLIALALLLYPRRLCSKPLRPKGRQLS